jgi:hypothetical protein
MDRTLPYLAYAKLDIARAQDFIYDSHFTAQNTEEEVLLDYVYAPMYALDHLSEESDKENKKSAEKDELIRKLRSENKTMRNAIAK